jgi:pimeloyl-ACP methyl ester carboxylesterase
MDYLPDQKYQIDNSTFLNYNKYGNGNVAVVFLAGFGQATYSWDKIKEKLDFDLTLHTLYFIDLLGFGFSSKQNNKIYSIKNQSKIILEAFHFLKINDITLLGHSYGGLVSLSLINIAYNTNSKIKFKSLILFDTPAYLGSEPSFIKILRNPIFNFLGTIFYSPKITTYQTIKNTFFNYDFGCKNFYELYYFFYNLSGYYKAMVMVANQTTEEDIIELSKFYSKIKLPTLLIWGENDKMIPLIYGNRLKQDIKNSVLKIIEKCGHIPLQEKPDESASIINEFIKTLP